MTNGSLADILKRRGRLHHTEVLDILQQVAAGLAYAHGKGIFHGALKPSNIVLNNQEEVLVAGFGLMRILQMRGIEQDERPYGHLFSIAGTFLTSAEYIAPEVVQGQPGDARTDIYSLGMILFELLSGKTPFMGTNPLEVAKQHVRQPVLSLRTHCPDIPLALAAIVNQALDRDPARRFQRVDELAEAFARVSAALSENGSNNRMRAIRNAGQDTLADWQFLPPIITGQLPVVRPTSPVTNNQELAQLANIVNLSDISPQQDWHQAQSLQRPVAPPMKVSPTFVPSAEKPVVTARSPQEAPDDSWTLPPQEPSRSLRSGSAQQNANLTRRGPTSNQRSCPLKGRKTGGNERISRRMVVALLVAGGVAAVGTAVAIYETNNASNQQVQNNAANLAKNAAMEFVDPANNKSIVLVHLSNGSFVAYDRTCTHQGVYVKYDPTKQLLVCPAHGATFDPARGGAVQRGPATKPLSAVTVHINADGTFITG